MKSTQKVPFTRFSKSKKFLAYFLAYYHLMFSSLAYAGNGPFGDDIEPDSKVIINRTLNENNSSFSHSYNALRKRLASNLRAQFPNYTIFAVGLAGTANSVRNFFSHQEKGEINTNENYLIKKSNTESIKKPSFLERIKQLIVGRNAYGFFPTVYAEEKTPIKQSGSEALEEIKERIETRQRELEPILSSLESQDGKGITVLLGSTGAGKTTVREYVLGNSLEVIKDSTGKICVKGEGIGQGYNSETKIPSIKNGWIDCPGLFDTNGPSQELLNAHSLPQVIEKSKRVRFLIVVTQSQLDTGAERGKSFLDLTENLSKMLQGNSVNDIKKGLNVVVTQGTYMDVTGFQNAINGLLNDRQHQLLPLQKELLQWMANPKNKQITIFEQPKLKKDKIIIPRQGRKPLIVNDAPYIEKVKVNITYSLDAENHIKQIAKGLTQEVTVCLEKFNTDFRQNTKKLVGSYDGDAENLRKLIKSAITPLQNVQSIENAFDNDVKIINTALGTFDPELQKKFSNLGDRRKFLLALKSKDSTVSLSLKKDGVLTEMQNSANQLSKSPKSNSVNTTLTLEGEIIGTSDIVKELLGLDNISMLQVMAAHSLMIDSNVDKPGVSVALAAPQWVVKGEKSISLRGRGAKEIIPHQAPDSQDGLPGMPGQSGGNFYGIANEVYSGSGLTIDVSGGTGGRGQTGGNGIDGEDGKEGCIEDVENRRLIKSQRTLERNIVATVLTANNAKRIELQSGEPAKEGGDSGAGGKGGYGGRAGSFAFEKYDNGKYYSLETGIQTVRQEGQDGPDGQPGEPGKGGVNKGVFTGTYIEKETDGYGLLGRMVVGASAGAAIGAKTTTGAATVASWLGSLGGPIGSAGAFLGIVGLGSAIGGVIGAITPLITSEIDKSVWIWEKLPSRTDNTSRAPDGKKPTVPNSHKRQPPDESAEIILSDIRKNWKNYIKE